MSQQRDRQGRFVPGNRGGPGRPPKTRELAYMLVAQDVIRLDDWRKIIELTKQLAFWGDRDARKFIADHIIGRPGASVSRVEIDPEYNAWLENASDEELRAILAEAEANGDTDEEKDGELTSEEVYDLIAQQDAKDATARKSIAKPHKRKPKTESGAD